MAAVWRAMDTQCQGSCGLRHFSPEAHEAAAGLRRHAAQHGGCAKLLAKLEAQGQVTKPIFRKALAEALNHSAADLLFEGPGEKNRRSFGFRMPRSDAAAGLGSGDGFGVFEGFRSLKNCHGAWEFSPS
ncbi:unnamed protein product [Effrenium voratum]|nr:unnamed protein product [Effrenium voratum]